MSICASGRGFTVYGLLVNNTLWLWGTYGNDNNNDNSSFIWRTYPSLKDAQGDFFLIPPALALAT